MEGQFYLMGLAGLSVSLAGFASLLTVFRPAETWDAVTLWRARTIVRSSIDAASAALLPVPVFYLTDSADWAVRAGTALILVLSLAGTVRASPQKQPEAWVNHSVVPFYLISAVTVAIMLANLALANLGVLLLVLLWELGLPASIFASVVEEFSPGVQLEESQ